MRPRPSRPRTNSKPRRDAAKSSRLRPARASRAVRDAGAAVGAAASERGERPTGEGFGAEAPQPTDDGLAAMAEIGGDFAVPTRGEGEAAEDEERAPSARRRRGRRGRRGGGDRDRFGAPAPTSAATPVEGEAEPNLFDEPPRETRVAEPELRRPPQRRKLRRPQRRSPRPNSTPDHAEAPASAAPASEREAVSASEPAAAADESASTAAPEATPAAEDPSRPRRSGWWQRARATLSGE